MRFIPNPPLRVDDLAPQLVQHPGLEPASNMPAGNYLTQAVHPNILLSRPLPLHPKVCEDQGHHNELGGHNFKSRTFMKHKAYRLHSYKRKRARVAGCKPLMKRIWGTSACPASSLASACSYLSNRSRVCSKGGAGEVKSRREPPPSHTWGGDGGWETSALTF